MDERRNGRRYSMRLPLEVKMIGAGQEELLGAETLDVSSRGLFFTLDRSLAAGSSIEFVLTLPPALAGARDVRVQCAGRILRVDKSDPKTFGVAAAIEQFEMLPAPS